MAGALTNLTYKPLSLACSIAGGALAGAAFTRAWRIVGDGEDAPEPTALDHRTAEVLLAAALHGAVFGVVRALVQRTGAKSYRRLTGRDPNA
ncbi:MAG TPA: DUF4235 domain-containing protein [Pseudonocardiaceae bacterium]